MKIINDIKNSVYSKPFYKSIENLDFVSIWKYFAKISLIQALLLTIILSIYIIPLLSSLFSQESKTKISNYFPAELVLNINKGQVTTNVQEPYVIPYSKIDNSVSELKNKKRNLRSENFITIDTKTQFSLGYFEAVKSDVLLTKDHMVLRKSNGQITIEPLKNFPDVSLSRAKIFEWISNSQPFFKFVIPIAVAFYFIAILIGSVVSNLTFLVISSFIIWITLKIQKKKINFEQIYKQALYAITSLLILEVILAVFGITISVLLSFLIFISVYFINTYPEKKVEAKVVSPDQPSQ
jgi:hypothetical protein